ncbi:MAG: AraC family transcriptional regulator [Pseudomonadota bacterium]
MTRVIDNADKVRPDDRIPPMTHEVDLGDLRVILLPPGEVHVRTAVAFTTFDVNIGTSEHDYALNSDRMKTELFRPGESLILPRGTDMRIDTNNPLPGCIVEVSDDAFGRWLDAGEIKDRDGLKPVKGAADAIMLELARTAIGHMMRASRSGVQADRLTVEALALGIMARGIAQIASAADGGDAEPGASERQAGSPAIARAIDLLESRLCEGDLLIQDLAEEACLSASHFSSVFKAMVGETPYAFILRRRAEHARDLIVGTSAPLSQIALETGFSSQAHMTVVVKRVLGATPAALRV